MHLYYIDRMTPSTKNEIEAEPVASSDPGLIRTEDFLETVKRLRACTGDCLSDEEFTFLMLEKRIRTPNGFRFLCFHNGCVTLGVPDQDENAWHSADHWILDCKEKIAKALAKKYGLMFSKPPDACFRVVLPYGMKTHHHLQFANRKETVIFVHPHFLKIRLYASDTHLILPPAPGLLEDLAAFYRGDLLSDERCQE